VVTVIVLLESSAESIEVVVFTSKVSLPAPPSKVSLPAPPIIRSSPAPPVTVSLPAPALSSAPSAVVMTNVLLPKLKSISS
jgi:hypothetical protein